MKKSILITILLFSLYSCTKTPLSTPSLTPNVSINGKDYPFKFATHQSTANGTIFAIVVDTANIGIEYNPLKPDSAKVTCQQTLNGKPVGYSYALNINNLLKRLFRKSPNIVQTSADTYTINDTFYVFNLKNNVGGVDSTQYRIVLSNIESK